MGGDVDRLLAGGGIKHQQHLLRLDPRLEPDQLLDQRLVDLEAAGRVEDQRLPLEIRRHLEGGVGDLEHVRFTPQRAHRDVELAAQRLQLVHRRRTIDVRRDEKRGTSLLLQHPGELGRAGGFPGSMKADHHDAGPAAGKVQGSILGTEQLDQLIVDDLHDLLPGTDGLDHVGPKALGLDALDEVAGDLEVHIGFQKGHPDLAERIRDVALGNGPEPAQGAEGVLELLGQAFEHGDETLKTGWAIDKKRGGGVYFPPGLSGW